MTYLLATLVLIAVILAFFGLARGIYKQFGVPQWLLRILVALPLLFSGIVLHFLQTDLSVRMMPPALPAPRFLILFTGVLEIAGAIGFFLPKMQRSAALWIATLMVAVFPANVYVAGQTLGNLHMPSVPVRLVMQVIYIWMVLLAGYGLPGVGKSSAHSIGDDTHSE